MHNSLLIESLPTAGGQQLICVTLNAPKKLNALTIEMVEILLSKLPQWDVDPDVIAIIMRGQGARAFCAGGDIRFLYHAMLDGNQTRAINFFQQEYRLNLMCHQLKTPLLAWGQGYVIGGGMGLLQGSAYRLGTSSSRLAMPEVSIGLFPDVGASWFLGHLPERMGLFMGLTGSQLNGYDARRLGLLNGLLGEYDYPRLLEALQQLPSQTLHAHHTAIRSAITELEQECLTITKTPASEIDPIRNQITAALKQPDLFTIIASLLSLEGQGSTWLDTCLKVLRHASPTALHLTYRQLQEPPSKLSAAFDREYCLAINATYLGEFQEGIRALLIDKDQQPNWRYNDIEQVPNTWIERFYQFPTHIDTL